MQNDTDGNSSAVGSAAADDYNTDNKIVLPKMTNKQRHTKMSKPIPIGLHHTVSGHEAMDLAKRLTDELASQQSQSGGSLGSSQRPVSPETEPRARSFEQREQKAKGIILKIGSIVTFYHITAYYYMLLY